MTDYIRGQNNGLIIGLCMNLTAEGEEEENFLTDFYMRKIETPIEIIPDSDLVVVFNSVQYVDIVL